MAVDPSTLIAPLGLVESSLFPGEDLTARLTHYVSEKGGEPDEAVEAWAYHRAFLAVYTRLSGVPSTASFGGGQSESYMQSQISNFKDLAERYLDRYHAIVDPAPVRTERMGTGSVRHDFTW